MATSLRESYELLGLPTNASEDEVKRAYKQKARECHPDKNPGDPRATEKFQELSQSYQRIISTSSSTSEHEPFYAGGFGSFFRFVIFQEMIRRRMQEAMLARMFGGLVFDDESDDDVFSGVPFYHQRRTFESSWRSQRGRFQNDSCSGRPFPGSSLRGQSPKPPKKEKRRSRRPATPEPSVNENKPEHTADSQNVPRYQTRGPQKEAGAPETGGNENKTNTTDSQNESARKFDDTVKDQTLDGKSGEKEFEREQQGEGRGKTTPNRKQKQVYGERQKRRKRKRGHKKW
ncbi:uncharacterized protein [Montipora foliosa]|uniref:uncharacterized protein n=1 Tax=Montipora foliosa TaxID=591990 RepID=UPI0035F1424F